MDRDDLLSVFGAALRTVVGWAFVLFTTTLFGLWLGMSIAFGEMASLHVVFMTLVVSPLSWLLFPQMLIAFAVTISAWYFLLRIESTRLRIAAASANFVAWLGITAWVFRSIPHG